MSFCPKCGKKTSEDMVFCPNCGAALKVGQAEPQPERVVRYRHEKEEKATEKREKHEKHEKYEVHEKREYGFLGPLIGGLILVFVGLSVYLSVEEAAPSLNAALWALFLIFVGVIIIAAAAYAVIMASRRHPRT